MKTAFIALVITIAPGLAMAECFGGHSDQVVMSCPKSQMSAAEPPNCDPLTTSYTALCKQDNEATIGSPISLPTPCPAKTFR